MAWLRKYWWLLLLGVVGLVWLVVYVGTATKVSIPLDPIHDKIAAADADVKLKKAKHKAKSDKNLKEIETIEKIDDGRERREALVKLLNQMDSELES